MLHNQTASVANLAKTLLQGLDRSQAQSVIPTATLELLLRSLIDLAMADNPTAKRMEGASASFVAAKISGLEGH